MATEMTPQERAAAVYRDLGDGCDLSAPEQEKRDIETIAAAFTATRRAALLEAAQQVCMHCGRRAIGLQVGVTGPNAAGNYVHNPPEDSQLKESALCSATSIWSLIRYEERLAQEG